MIDNFRSIDVLPGSVRKYGQKSTFRQTAATV